MGEWGGPLSGSRQVIRSTKQILFAFWISAAWYPQNPSHMLSLNKNNVSRIAKRTGNTFTVLSQTAFGSTKTRLPLDENSVSMDTERSKHYKPRTFERN